MVTVNIIVEGGVLPGANIASQTISNSAAFREAFRKLFQSCFGEKEVKIVVEIGTGYKNAVKMLIQNPDRLLLIDLDGPPDSKAAKLIEFESHPNNAIAGFSVADHGTVVFFMIQAMEAWFLSQPEIIESVLAHSKSREIAISIDPKLNSRNPELIVHPDKVLDYILKKYFQETKNGRVMGLKYKGKKLKLAPQLLESLDLEKLKTTFSEVDRLFTHIQTMV